MIAKMATENMKKFINMIRFGAGLIGYAVCEIKAPLPFKLKYLTEKLLKVPLISINVCCKTSLKLPCLFKEDYVLENGQGRWKIRHNSDMDYTINPLFERELREYFVVKKGVFIDIGANVGKWSISVARKSKDVKVYAFEPNPLTYPYLIENIALNKLESQIMPINKGVSASEGNVSFEIDSHYTALSKVIKEAKETEESKRETSSIRELCTNRVFSFLRKVLLEKFAIKNDFSKLLIMQIPITSLDLFIKKNKIACKEIALIKIDVEGHEYEVLQGMKETIKHLAKGSRVICEIWNKTKKKEEMIELFRQKGFSVERINNSDNYLFTKH